MFERIDTRNIFKLQIDKIVLYPPYGIEQASLSPTIHFSIKWNV